MKGAPLHRLTIHSPCGTHLMAPTEQAPVTESPFFRASENPPPKLDAIADLRALTFASDLIGVAAAGGLSRIPIEELPL